MRSAQAVQEMLDKVTRLVESAADSMQRDIDNSSDVGQAVEVKQIYLSYSIALLDILAWECPPDISQASIQALQPILTRLEHNVSKASHDH
jgi:hypothetical protein